MDRWQRQLDAWITRTPFDRLPHDCDCDTDECCDVCVDYVYDLDTDDEED